MTERRWRILTALLAVAAALVMLDSVEKYRAARVPSGWVSTPAVPGAMDTPRIGTSRWELAPGASWHSEERVSQWYLRADFTKAAALHVRHGATGPGLRLQIGVAPRLSAAEDHTCEGELPTVGAGPYPLVFERTQDGYLYRSADGRIACSASIQDESPYLEVEGGRVALVSIGLEEWPAGVPLSGNGWLGGLALIGFLWMLLLELERYRGVAWPVVIATGLPTLPAAALLWIDPAATTVGYSSAVMLVVLALALKAGTIIVGGKAFPAREE